LRSLIDILEEHKPEAVYRCTGAKIAPDSFVEFYNGLLELRTNAEDTGKVLFMKQEYLMENDHLMENELTPVVFDSYTGETFSPVFMSWEEVLNCPVSEESLEMHGVENSLLAILCDLTFWGAEEKQSQRIKQAVAAQKVGGGYSEASLYALGMCASP